MIIPNYNGEQFIAAAIESVRTQTYPCIEVLIVDDGSTDRSVQIIEQQIQNDPVFHLIKQPNRGVAAARNTGIARATGEFIAPLDSDDIWLPGKLRAQVESVLASDEDVGLVYTWSASIDSNGHCTGGVNASDREGVVLADLLFENFVGNGSAPLIRRDHLVAVGGYSEEFSRLGATGCEDRDLYLRLAERCRFYVVPKVLVGYRQHENNMSKDVRTMRRSHRLVLRKLKQRHPIPGKFLRRSSAFNALYLGKIQARKKRFAASVLNIARALYYFPGLIFEPGFYGLVRLRTFQLGRHLLPWFRRFRRKPKHGQRRATPQPIELLQRDFSPPTIKWIGHRKRDSSHALRRILSNAAWGTNESEKYQ